MSDQNDKMQAEQEQNSDIVAQAQKAAHKLNNHLGIIRGNIEMLSMEVSFDEKAQRRLERINSAIDNASQIVTALHAQTRKAPSASDEKKPLAAVDNKPLASDEKNPLAPNDNNPLASVAKNPSAPVEKKPENETSAITKKNEELSQHERHQNILIVDDEVDLVEVVMRQLEFRGFKVFAATSAEEAIAILEKQTDIDLLFSDVVMNTGMNGLQLARHVNEHFPQVKILLTTGHTQQLEKSQNSDDEFIYALLTTKLPKPYTHQELVDAIEKLL